MDTGLESRLLGGYPHILWTDDDNRRTPLVPTELDLRIELLYLYIYI